MPTVSQHYGHHAVPGAVDETRTRQQAAPVVLMVSGGADSTALLLMACTSKLDIQDGRGVAPIARERLHVLHVNHHLRGKASDGDEAFVRELCAQYGLPLCVEHAYFDGESGNIEAAEVCSPTLRPDGGAANGGSYLHRAHVFGSRGNVFDERD